MNAKMENLMSKEGQYNRRMSAVISYQEVYEAQGHPSENSFDPKLKMLASWRQRMQNLRQQNLLEETILNVLIRTIPDFF